ncbi:MAG: glutamine-hydrolyzing carbamoyl-phosphate synthase small subunit [Actinobacteria bacterium]|nr:glutamine-hydrolyzing carbamoyl-phosphate synthase small subunit [Actinomycetota bacterium]MCL5887271.1 glutamine-hydrolyzing carbamoyl-phosphate synthase small subunit [Actinomycetota bacterium]
MSREQAVLALEDGTVFRGISCGAPGEAFGELVFNTSLTGYQEVLTDPSYAGQIVTMTSPHIGNYGVNAEDMESRGVFASGFVVRSMCDIPSNWRAQESLPDFLIRHGVVALEGIDTRSLTKRIREAGAMRSVISTLDSDPASLVAKAQGSPGLVGRDLVAEVTAGKAFAWETHPDNIDREVQLEGSPVGQRRRVVAFDSGIKYNILRRLEAVGCEVTVVPPDTSASDVMALGPEGLFFANGPGDPAAVDYLYSTLRELLGEVPIFGICLGHQMLSLALGAKTYKLKYGHRGGNQPVMELLTGKVEITSQNHGFCVDFSSIGPLLAEDSGCLDHDPGDLGAWVASGVAPVVASKEFGRVQLTHVNLNDMTVEGIRLLDYPAFSVQYHPESAPGPHDSRYLFDSFMQMMEGA